MIKSHTAVTFCYNSCTMSHINLAKKGPVWQTGPKLGPGPKFRTAGPVRTGPSVIPVKHVPNGRWVCPS